MNISASELKEKLISNEKPYIIDVREKLEFHTFNIGGENIPLGSLPEALENLTEAKDSEVIVICQRGIRSATAQGILKASGFSNVRNLEGGLLGFRKIAE